MENRFPGVVLVEVTLAGADFGGDTLEEVRCKGSLSFDMKLEPLPGVGVDVSLFGIFDEILDCFDGVVGSEQTTGTSMFEGSSLTKVPWRFGIVGGERVESASAFIGGSGPFDTPTDGVLIRFFSATGFFFVNLLENPGLLRPTLTVLILFVRPALLMTFP